MTCRLLCFFVLSFTYMLGFSQAEDVVKKGQRVSTLSAMKTIANEHRCIVERVGKGIFLYNYETQKEIKLLEAPIGDHLFLTDFETNGESFLLTIADREYKPYGRCLYFRVDTSGSYSYLYKDQVCQRDLSIKETIYQSNGTVAIREYNDSRFVSEALSRKQMFSPIHVGKLQVYIDRLSDGALNLYKNDTLYLKLKNKAIFYNSKFGSGYYAAGLSSDGTKMCYGYTKQVFPLIHSTSYIGIMDTETKNIDFQYEGGLSNPIFSKDNTLILCHSARTKDYYSAIINPKTREVRRIEASYMMWLEQF